LTLSKKKGTINGKEIQIFTVYYKYVPNHAGEEAYKEFLLLLREKLEQQEQKEKR